MLPQERNTLPKVNCRRGGVHHTMRTFWLHLIYKVAYWSHIWKMGVRATMIAPRPAVNEVIQWYSSPWCGAPIHLPLSRRIRYVDLPPGLCSSGLLVPSVTDDELSRYLITAPIYYCFMTSFTRVYLYLLTGNGYVTYDALAFIYLFFGIKSLRHMLEFRPIQTHRNNVYNSSTQFQGRLRLSDTSKSPAFNLAIILRVNTPSQIPHRDNGPVLALR